MILGIMKSINLYIVLIILHMLNPSAFAQISAYHSIVNPYKKSVVQMPAFSAYFSAVPPKEGFLSVNPSSMINSNRMSITLAGSYVHSSMDIPSKIEHGDIKNDDQLYPGSIGFQYASGANNPKMLFHLILNPQVSTIRYLDHLTGEQTNTEKREGKPGSISPGLVLKAMKRWGIGLSWTKWFGKTKLTETVPDWSPTMSPSSMTMHYNGSNFQVSNYLDLSLFHLGIVYYTPFTLMTVSNLSHEFQGAYEIGISSELSSSIKVAVNFYYQDNSELRNWDGEDNSYENYTNGKELTIGMEYESLKSKFPSPMFFLVKLHWLPLVEGSGDDYLGKGLESDDLPGYELVLGSNITISKFTVLFSGHYREQYSRIWEYAIVPPFS